MELVLSGVTLRVNSKLAEEIGLNESIVLLQLDWWIKHSRNIRDERRWTYQSLEDMREKAFPFWSKGTIGRAVNNLLARGFIVEGNYNRHRYDKTRWFSLECEAIDALGSVQIETCMTQDEPSMSQIESSMSQIETTIPENPHKESNRDKLIAFPARASGNTHSALLDDKDDKSVPKMQRDDKDMSVLVKLYGQVAVDKALKKAEAYDVKKNLAGYVRRICENDKRVNGNPLVRSMRGAGVNNASPRQPAVVSPSPLRKEGERKATPAVKSEEAKTWEIVLGQLELQLDRNNFQTWVRDCEFVSASGGVWVIQAVSGYARDMLQHRLYKNVWRVLSDVLGAEVRIEFVARGEAVSA